MAVGWYSVLQMVPWADVISNAPKIAEAARKLWNSASKKPLEEPVLADAEAGAARTPEARALAELHARLEATEGALVELHQQLLDSTALINTLASQNAQLVQRIEANRIRMRWLTLGTAVALLGLAGLGIRLFVTG